MSISVTALTKSKVINMKDKQVMQNAYNEARKKKVIESLQALDAETVCAYADSIFFETFETPAERWIKDAKEFNNDIIPF